MLHQHHPGKILVEHPDLGSKRLHRSPPGSSQPPAGPVELGYRLFSVVHRRFDGPLIDHLLTHRANIRGCTDNAATSHRSHEGPTQRQYAESRTKPSITPGIGKTHLAIGLGVKAAHAGHSVLFDTASNWITRLATAHQAGRLEAELKKIRRYRLIIIDEVGYIPFDQDAANLFFQLIASRYEQGSVMVTSNLPFGRWGDTFSDDVVAAAMIDRLVHHAEVLTLTGDSYRTRQRRELLAKENRTHRD
ncbi:ATP-binding protein [Streptomyces sp. NPDC097981]|uniref:ATP-binding protein n=1 Tax=Streptomyces sp. NPDC097981 TaxID=3155428 RepID=UPI00332AD901